MNYLFSTALLTILTMSLTHGSVRKSIYGEDNRVFVEDSDNELYKKLSRSTAVKISDKFLVKSDDGDSYLVKSRILQDIPYNVCEDVKFSKNLSVGDCSGFLVGEDLLVTVGHCVMSMSDCSDFKWVFNFRNDVMTKSKNTIDAKEVYSCKEIVNQQVNFVSGNDFAVLRLDRKVRGREPLEIRKKGKIELGTELVIIGNPSGLPTIVADDAYVTSNENHIRFKANSDTFSGSSGSAVFNAKSGVVEGILASGDKDFEYDFINRCNQLKLCENDSCRGEEIVRITVIPELVPEMTPVEPKLTRVEQFRFWKSNLTDADLYLIWVSLQDEAAIEEMSGKGILFTKFTSWLSKLDLEVLYDIWLEKYSKEDTDENQEDILDKKLIDLEITSQKD